MLVQPTYQQIHEESAEQAIIQKVREKVTCKLPL